MIAVLIALLYVVLVISSLLLIGVIFIQKSKGGGFGSGFGAAMGESMFGTHAAKALVKMTIVLSTVFVIATVLIAKLSIPPESAVATIEAEKKAPKPMQLPQGGMQPGALPSGTLPAPDQGALTPSAPVPNAVLPEAGDASAPAFAPPAALPDASDASPAPSAVAPPAAIPAAPPAEDADSN
jgi:preprotein translocase subunit SecG